MEPDDLIAEERPKALGCFAVGLAALLVGTGIVTGMCQLVKGVLPEDRIARFIFIVLINAMCVLPFVWHCTWKYAGLWATGIGIRICIVVGVLTLLAVVPDKLFSFGWVFAWLPSWVTLILLRRGKVAHDRP